MTDKLPGEDWERYENKNGAAMIPNEYDRLEEKVDEIRDIAREAGVVGMFPDEGNFALNCINAFVEQNAYPQHEGDAILHRYVLKYCLERNDD